MEEEGGESNCEQQIDSSMLHKNGSEKWLHADLKIDIFTDWVVQHARGFH